MKHLIRLKEVKLYKDTKTQSVDGDYSTSSTLYNTYNSIVQELRDEVSIDLYGADVVNMIRVASNKQLLETYLYSKLNNTSDNISKYHLEFGGYKYKITSVYANYVDCKRYE